MSVHVADPKAVQAEQPSLRRKAASGSLITATRQVAVFLIGLGSTVVLARLLPPEAFGLVAIANTFVALMRIFRDGGLSMATIRAPEISHQQQSNLFWANVGLGLFLGIVVAACGPLLSWIFDAPDLVPVIGALSVTFLIGSMGVQPRALLRRRLQFGQLGAIDITAMLAGSLAAIGLAWGGAGFWALVALQLVTAIVDAIMTAVLAAWRPTWPRQDSGTKKLLQFGAGVTVASAVRRFAQNSDTILLGRYFDTVAVGHYSRGLALLLRPMEQFLQPFESVFLPILSRLQSQPERFSNAFRRAFGTVTLLSFPLAAGLFVCSDLIVQVFLGPAWNDVVPIFRWLSLAAVGLPMANAAGWILTCLGCTRQIMQVGIISSAAMFIAFIIGVKWGSVGISIAYAVSIIGIRLPLNALMARKANPSAAALVCRIILIHSPLWALPAALVYLLRKMADLNSVTLELMLSAFVGATSALLTIFVLPTLRREAILLVQSFRSGTKTSTAESTASTNLPVSSLEVPVKPSASHIVIS